jgi:hypothetical protein
MRFENTITIRRPPAEVFAYLADFENVPTWNYAIVETKKLSQGPVGVGTKYRQVRKLPRPSEESFEVTGYEPEARLSVDGTFGPFPGRFGGDAGYQHCGAAAVRQPVRGGSWESSSWWADWPLRGSNPPSVPAWRNCHHPPVSPASSSDTFSRGVPRAGSTQSN